MLPNLNDVELGIRKSGKVKVLFTGTNRWCENPFSHPLHMGIPSHVFIRHQSVIPAQAGIQKTRNAVGTLSRPTK
jgi:hypothetical protein